MYSTAESAMYSPNDPSDTSLPQLTPSDASSSTFKSTPILMNASITPGALPGSLLHEFTSGQYEPSKKVERRGRKGHTKSRAGCLNCKQARIKVRATSLCDIQLTYIVQ